jgi:hypothetical protein
MIAAGICNLTQKTDIEGGGYFLNYEVKTSSERVESVKNDIINSLGPTNREGIYIANEGL